MTSSPAEARRSLGPTIRAARVERRGGTVGTDEADRGRVAARLFLEHGVRCAAGTLREIEAGRRLPSPLLLLALDVVLEPAEPHADPHARAAVWFAQWLAASTASDGSQRSTELSQRGAAAADRIRTAVGRMAGRGAGPFTLADGIEAFEPLAVITGDRREWPAKTRGDMFVSSASPSVDLAFAGPLLRRLSRPARVFSDKVIAVSAEDHLRRTLGQSHLLILGAISVNLAARLTNGTAPFYFDLPAAWQEWDRKVRTDPALGDARIRRVAWQLVRSVPPEGATDFPPGAVAELRRANERRIVDEALEVSRKVLSDESARLRSLGEVIGHFQTPGIMDTVRGRIYSNPRMNEDYGLVSLARHPFSDDHVAIVVAGLHGFGTAHALQVLAEQPEYFRRRAAGAVMTVSIPDAEQLAWAQRLWDAHVVDGTPEYDLADLTHKIADIRRGRDQGRVDDFANWSGEDLDHTLALLQRLTPASSADPTA